MTDDPHDHFAGGQASEVGGTADLRKALEAKAADFDAVRKAVDDAGSFVRGLWVTYVLLGTYIVIAAASVTHRQLFLETPIKLPLLDVQLPLVAFFVVAPWFFVVFHFYLLLQLTLLAGKIGHYNTLLWSALPPARDGATPDQRLAAASDDLLRDQLRQQLPNDLLVQFLAGPRNIREQAMGGMLRLVAWTTMVVGPIAVLLLVQLKFLPYQDELTTWAQRVAVLVDLGLLLSLWPAVALGRGALRPLKSWPPKSWIAASFVVFAVSLFALTFPREAIDETPPAQAFHSVMTWPIEASAKAETEPQDWEKGERRETKVTIDGVPRTRWVDASWLRRLFGKSVEWRLAFRDEDEARWLARAPAARRVVAATLRLREESFVDDEKLAKMEARSRELKLKASEGERTLRLAPRFLIAADLKGADLRRSDLRGVRLDDAWLHSVRLDGALLDRVRGVRASLTMAQLQGASLDGAQLQGASLKGAQLRGASLAAAQLQGASLVLAQLQGASLFAAQMQGALLDGARLQGASLFAAKLQGASLFAAQLQGASLERAQLQGASLERARLQGASLDWARLQGASFDRAQLQGASLAEAQLQGASLDGALCHRAGGVAGDGGAAGRPDCGRTFFLDAVRSDSGALTDEVADRWRRELFEAVGDRRVENRPNGTEDWRKDVTRRFEQLKQSAMSPAQEMEISQAWAALVTTPFDAKAYAEGLVTIVCAKEEAPFVARGVLRNNVLAYARQHKAIIAAAMRAGRAEPDKCPGVAGFTEEDWRTLDERSPPTSSPSR